MDLSIAVAGLFLLMQSNSYVADQPVSLTPDGEDGCTLETHDYCRLIGAIDLQAAEARLAETNQTFWREGDTLFIAARRSPDTPRVRMCCALQTDMELLGDGIWGVAYRLSRIDEAFVEVWPTPLLDQDELVWRDRPVYRGPHSLPPVESVPEGALRGRLEMFDVESEALGKPRRVTVYVPQDAGPSTSLPVAYVADGGNVYSYGPIAEALADTCAAAPVILVGLWNEDPGPEEERSQSELRAADYLWGHDPERFQAHDTFLLEDVMPLAEERFGASPEPEDRMLSGSSNGAAWAVSTALLHPELFATVSAASLGWIDALGAGEIPDDRVTFHISAGYYEPRFLPDSEAAVEQINAAGGTAHLTRYVSGHSPLAFEQQFARSLAATFPADGDCVPLTAD